MLFWNEKKKFLWEKLDLWFKMNELDMNNIILDMLHSDAT